MKKKVLITGASGFIGKALLDSLVSVDEYDLYAASRSIIKFAADSEVKSLIMPDMDAADVEFKKVVESMDCIVHTAGLAHAIGRNKKRDDSSYFRINRDATLLLARQASELGVKRFVFLSSIGVNGAQNVAPFSEESPINPVNAYALSKHEAEHGLLSIAENSDMEVVVIRPPMVFGLDAPGNFQRLVGVIERRIPMPFGAIDNKRTLIGIDNLCSFIQLCIEHNAAANQVFVIGEGRDISTLELFTLLSELSGKNAKVLYAPLWLIRIAGFILGKSQIVEQLCGSLQVSSDKAKSLLNWKPGLSIEEGLRRVYPRRFEK